MSAHVMYGFCLKAEELVTMFPKLEENLGEFPLSDWDLTECFVLTDKIITLACDFECSDGEQLAIGVMVNDSYVAPYNGLFKLPEVSDETKALLDIFISKNPTFTERPYYVIGYGHSEYSLP